MNDSSWSNLSALDSNSMISGNPSFVTMEAGFGKGGVYKIYVTRSGLYGGKLAKQDPKVARSSTAHLGLIGLLIGRSMAKKAEKKIAEKEAEYAAINPEDSSFLTIDAGNFRVAPMEIASIEIKSKLGVLGWGSDYDCSFTLHTNDGKKRTFLVKKGLGSDALQNTLRALTMNIVMR